MRRTTVCRRSWNRNCVRPSGSVSNAAPKRSHWPCACRSLLFPAAPGCFDSYTFDCTKQILPNSMTQSCRKNASVLAGDRHVLRYRSENPMHSKTFGKSEAAFVPDGSWARCLSSALEESMRAEMLTLVAVLQTIFGHRTSASPVQNQPKNSRVKKPSAFRARMHLRRSSAHNSSTPLTNNQFSFYSCRPHDP